MISTADEMRLALYRHFGDRYAVLFEVATDRQEETVTVNGQPHCLRRRRRIDMLLVQRARRPGSGPVELIAVEIKVTRADFFADVRAPQKQAPWREVAHRHAYAVPTGLVDRGEVPAGSGLLTVGDRPGHAFYWPVAWAVRAPRSQPFELPTWLLMAFACRASQAEAKVRGLSWDTRDDAGQSAEDLRAALLALRKDADLLARQLDRARTEARAWRQAFAAQGFLPCGYCQQPVRPTSVRQGHFAGWRHVDPGHDAECAPIRARTGAWTPIEPADDTPVPSTGAP